MEARRDVVEGDDGDVHRARLQIGEGEAPGALGRRFPRRRKQLTHADVDAGRALAQLGEQRRQEHGRDAVRRADREPARGPGRIERLGGRDDASHPRQHVRDRGGQFRRARGRHDALGRSQEQRIVEQPTQPAEPVADGRRRQVQPLGGAADVTLLQHDLEQDEQVEVGSGEINFIQHIAEIISLDSATPNCDLLPRNRSAALERCQTERPHVTTRRRRAVAAALAGPRVDGPWPSSSGDPRKPTRRSCAATSTAIALGPAHATTSR